MTDFDSKGNLHHYLRGARSAVVWKLDGLSEYDLRRPLTGTGTNLLGLVKHLSGVELLYFGVAFGRFPAEVPDWFGEDMEPNADMWATEAEASRQIIDTYRAAAAHADATIAALALDDVGFAPWLDVPEVTLHRVLVHVLAETERHAGHADLVRELVDGAVGRLPDNPQMTPGAGPDAVRTSQDWADYRSRVEQAALRAAKQ
jgi:Protein of unknown function (DUF664)